MKLFLAMIAAVSAALPMMNATAIVGSREITSETRVVESFHSIRVTNAADVTITQSDTQSVTIRTDTNILPLIGTKVEHGCLVISGLEENLKPSELTIEITVPELNAIDVPGVADVRSRGKIKAESFEIGIAGTADVNLSLDVEKLQTRITGVADLRVDGRAGAHLIRINGVGKVHAYEVETRTIEATISGQGTCEVNVAEKLDIEISGMGTLTYKGNPAITKKVTGIGSVRQAETQ